MDTRKLLTTLLMAACACPMSADNKKAVENEPKDPNEMVAYLFTYFNSNDPKDEQICYALSDDGYNYTPLNGGMPVIESDTIALTQCVRDPHILRCEDGKTFYMVATDMRSALGWSSNRGMVLLKSTDLVHWQHSTVNFPTRYTKTWKNVIRVWAPETIYDHQAGKYMVFYSLRTSDPGSYDKIYYQYANKDFTDLEGEPKWLFDAGNATIDGDIVYNEADQLYHLFYKQESGRGIYQAVAKNLTDKWQMLDVKGDQVTWATGNAWAPCIIEKKGKYYFYFSAHNPQSRRKEIGVAVSDSPTGPFVDSGAPIITDADRPQGVRGGQAIDVDVFQDPKSGKCYLYWGNGFMAGAELNDDMLSVKKETITNLTPQGGDLQTWAFREGAYVFWRKGTYYFMWSVDDTGSPNYHVCYGTAKSPLGPITLDESNYMVIKQKPEDKIYGTAHNSVLQIPGKDEWYIVYHRINKNFVNHEPGIHREVCIDRLTFDRQGRIIPVMPTLDGPAPLPVK